MKKTLIINNLFFTSLIISVLFLVNSIFFLHHRTENLWIKISSFTVTFISMIVFLYLLNVKVIWFIKKTKNIEYQNLTTIKRLIFWYVVLILILLLGVSFVIAYNEYYIKPSYSYDVNYSLNEKPDPYKHLEKAFFFRSLYCLGISFIVTSVICIIVFTILFFKENFIIEKKEEETKNEINDIQN